jgi:hypothetical protein
VPRWGADVGLGAVAGREDRARGGGAGRLKDGDKLPAKAVVTVGGINLAFEVDGEIELT